MLSGRVEIGFGDAVKPGVTDLELPVLLDLPAPLLRAYPRETVVAEKFQAMVALGRANSRMKDLYDIWLLSRSCEFKGDGLATRLLLRLHGTTGPSPYSRPMYSQQRLQKSVPSDSNGFRLPKASTRKCERSPWWSKSLQRS